MTRTSDPGNRPSPGGTDLRAALLLGAGLLLVAVLAWSPTASGVWHDDGVYLLLGKALAQGEGLRYAGVSGAPPAAKFPPLFPLSLAAVWRLAPGFPENAPFFQVLNLAFLAGAGTAFFLYLSRGLALPSPVAWLTVGLAWLCPALWALAVVPLSEPLFLLLLTLSLWAGGRLEGEAPDLRRRALLFVGAFALAFHTRTVGLAALLGVVAALLSRGRSGRALLVASLSGAVTLPWILWSARVAERIPEPLRDILGPYGPWLLEEMSRDPVLYLAQLGDRAGGLTGELLALLAPGAPAGSRWVVAVALLPLLVAGATALWRRSRATALTLAVYVAALWVWPFQSPRLVTPLLPWMVLLVVVGAWSLLAGSVAPGPGRVQTLVGGVAVAWTVLFAASSAWSLGRGHHARPYEIRSRALGQAVVAVERSAEPGAVVGAPELWAAVHLYTGRTVSPSARFRPLAREGPSWGSPAAQFRLWDAAGVDLLLAEHGGGVHGSALDRLERICGEEASSVVEVLESGFLVRLDWGEECRRALGLVGG